jgi:hypothetical protein
MKGRIEKTLSKANQNRRSITDQLGKPLTSMKGSGAGRALSDADARRAQEILSRKKRR